MRQPPLRHPLYGNDRTAGANGETTLDSLGRWRHHGINSSRRDVGCGPPLTHHDTSDSQVTVVQALSLSPQPSEDVIDDGTNRHIRNIEKLLRDNWFSVSASTRPRLCFITSHAHPLQIRHYPESIELPSPIRRLPPPIPWPP